jgi:flap endonuclease-1
VRRPIGHDVGVNLRDLFPQHPVPDDWYEGKRIAIDGHNVAFRYLTSIRGKDGDVLRNEQGRAISHLLGFTGLVRQLRERGAEPIVVWDGPVHPRKQATVDGRIRKRKEAQARADAAKAAGDYALYHRLLRSTVHFTPEMIHDATRLLEAVGVAVLTAEHDGERYGAALCAAGYADAVATEDFDALVAGAPWVLRKAGGGEPFLHNLNDLAAHNLTQDQLRHVAIVCGTDWHPGVKGFGAKTAVKALATYPSFSDLFADVEAGNVEETRYHKLIAKGAMSHAEFLELDQFILELPTPEEPRKAKPCPEMATATAEDVGISADRVLACFC